MFLEMNYFHTHTQKKCFRTIFVKSVKQIQDICILLKEFPGYYS